ncbi:ATP-binding protein [uncultured Tateyamaria sp.]|uniref:sensor histidine kinase n=1 Tax=uncultured Tateyamaria sp. TaxID=455651 RepID=UPI00261C9042|nr:ATP-binding protein [uncultured Tateyamaria sp.]
MDHTARIRTIFEEAKHTERVLSNEFLIRLVLVIVACSCGWLFLGMAVLPYWVVIYYVAVFAEKTVLHMPIDGRETTAFAMLWIVSFVQASIYAALPVYIWSMEDPVWQFGTVILFTGAVLNIFLLRSRNWLLGAAYLIPVIMATLWIAAGFYEGTYGGAAFWSATVLCLCLAVYFGVCLSEAHRANRELKETREQFLQAQKVEALGTLTSGVAHDFNNLLSVIQGNLELLETYPDDNDRDEFLSAALTAAQRGAHLTRQLTSYGRKAELWPRHIAPDDILRTLEDMARRVLPANIALKIRFGGTTASIFTDETLLQSALLNLVINARDAMPKGGSLHIKVTDVARPASSLKLAEGVKYIAFEVTDTGQGIPADILPSIRDPFFTTKAVGQGSGLGLPMVCGFAVQSGGEVEINSRVGKGTSIRLYLPRSEPRPDQVVTQARAQPTSTSPN